MIQILQSPEQDMMVTESEMGVTNTWFWPCDPYEKHNNNLWTSYNTIYIDIYQNTLFLLLLLK